MLEAADRLGGKIRTDAVRRPRRSTTRADAFLARVPEAIDLCRALGLGDELVTPAERTAYVW